MATPREPRVEPNPKHLVRPRHKKVDDGVGHHAVWEALYGVVVALSDVEAVPLRAPLVHREGVLVGRTVTSHLCYCTSYLGSVGQTDGRTHKQVRTREACK